MRHDRQRALLDQGSQLRPQLALGSLHHGQGPERARECTQRSRVPLCPGHAPTHGHAAPGLFECELTPVREHHGELLFVIGAPASLGRALEHHDAELLGWMLGKRPARRGELIVRHIDPAALVPGRRASRELAQKVARHLSSSIVLLPYVGRMPCPAREERRRVGDYSGPVSEARCESSSQLPSGSRTKEMRAVSPSVIGAVPSTAPRSTREACTESTSTT